MKTGTNLSEERKKLKQKKTPTFLRFELERDFVFSYLALFASLQASRSTQRTMFAPPKLTVSGVFAKLREIAAMTGGAVCTKHISLPSVECLRKCALQSRQNVCSIYPETRKDRNHLSAGCDCS